MYHVTIAPQAKRELKLLSKRHGYILGQIIEELKEDPYVGKLLSRELTDYYSFRVGVYRIIYKIKEEDEEIVILSAGHRSVVYQ